MEIIYVIIGVVIGVVGVLFIDVDALAKTFVKKEQEFDDKSK